MQTQPLRSIIESRFILLPNLPYIKRDTPIRIEKSMGPARSPTVFVSPSAFSAKVEAHWLTACSLEPAQSMSTMNIQKAFVLSISFIESFSSSSPTTGAIGTRVNITALTIGRIAHISDIIFQLSVENRAKNRVDMPTAATLPQQ